MTCGIIIRTVFGTSVIPIHVPRTAISHPGVAQLVSRLLWEQDAARSNRVTRTNERAEGSILSALSSFQLARLNLRYPAKQVRSAWFGQKNRPPPVADKGRFFLGQRSKKSRISVSPMIFFGRRNWRRSRGCRTFKSCHSDQDRKPKWFSVLIFT